MKYGLDKHIIDNINSIFANYSQVEKVVIYGSRAKGNYRPNSDIDLTFIGDNVDVSLLNNISWALDDLLLPYKFDLSVFRNISQDDLLEHIKRVGLVFYQK
jgi:predicted nucleotidyltransferase